MAAGAGLGAVEVVVELAVGAGTVVVAVEVVEAVAGGLAWAGLAVAALLPSPPSQPCRAPLPAPGSYGPHSQDPAPPPPGRRRLDRRCAAPRLCPAPPARRRLLSSTRSSPLRITPPPSLPPSPPPCPRCPSRTSPRAQVVAVVVKPRRKTRRWRGGDSWRQRLASPTRVSGQACSRQGLTLVNY